MVNSLILLKVVRKESLRLFNKLIFLVYIACGPSKSNEKKDNRRGVDIILDLDRRGIYH